MSTSGKYGERQSWRRSETNATGKRRILKAALTALAIFLLIVFVYLMLPGPKPKLVTILVTNDYDTDLVTPLMYGESVRASLKPFRQEELGGVAEVIRGSFQSTDVVSKYLSDPDDTVMVILRGYLMQDGKNRPALACSDLGLGPNPDAPQGLLPLNEILEPLSTSAPDNFKGVRLVVLDVEPMAAHPSLGQWDDQVFAQLDQTLQQLTGPHAERLWVLVTRGPMQNVGWDHTTNMPISTQTLISGINGDADLDDDSNVHLHELCRFMAERYERLPRNPETETPRIMLLQGKTGLISSSDFARLDRNLWIAHHDPKTDSKEDDAEPAPEEPQEIADDLADKIAAARQPKLMITPVALQTGSASATAAAGSEEPSAISPSPADTQPDTADKDASTPAAAEPAPETNATTKVAAEKAAEKTFWDLKDQFESIPLASSSGNQDVSAISLAPHLWRRLVFQMVGAQVKDYDPASPTETPRQVAADLSQLQRTVSGQTAQGAIDDSIVRNLDGFVKSHRAQRRTARSDRRLMTADSLQHAVAAARARLWSWLEFQRQASIGGTLVPDQSLLVSTEQAEQLLSAGKGSERPDQASLDRQLSRLHADINLFDRNVDGEVKQLLQGFSLDDPPRTWELTRAAWAWLRSPLPTGQQRRQLEAAIAAARIDLSDTQGPVQAANAITFAAPQASQSLIDLNSNYRRELSRFETYHNAPGDPVTWAKWLAQESTPQIEFEDRWGAALRIDPCIAIDQADATPIVHSITAMPLIRKPNVALIDDRGQVMGPSAILRLETNQDLRRVTLQINPDSERSTRLLVNYEVRSSSGNQSDAPVEIKWNFPGAGGARQGDAVPITIDADSQRSLQLQIRPTGLAESVDDLSLRVSIRAERDVDEIEGVVGTYTIPIELPRQNRLRLVASAFRGIGCSKEVLSHVEGLPSGLWLRTFNERNTPFQLEVFNQAGKACQAKVWLIKLPSPMPPDVVAYWPDVAADRYSNPEGGVLDRDGRIYDTFLRPERILKGPSKLAIPADQQRVKLSFAPPPPSEGSPPPPPPTEASQIDVSHGMALVCRFVDQDDNVMLEKDQIIYLVAKPWAADAYLNTKVVFSNDEVEVNAELNRMIDGDLIPDEIPEIEKRPVEVCWKQDDQWASFQPRTTEPPMERCVNLSPQTGKLRDFFSVPVVRRQTESWVRLDIDGWPRAIRLLVQHQSGDLGQPRFKNEIKFSSIALTRRPIGNQEQPTMTYHWPENEVYFQGNGQDLIATIHADGVFSQSSTPEVILEVAGKPYPSYQTDRLIATTATLTDDGVVNLLTRVSDIVVTLSQGQSSNAQIPITASLKASGVEESKASITAVLDSIAPESISIAPRRPGPYFPNDSVEFSISASDSRREASGISRIEFGLDTKEDGKADTKRDVHVFDPPVGNAVVPVAKSTFKFPTAGPYGVIVRALDAAGNETTEPYNIVVSKPKPDPLPGSDGKPAPAGPKMGRLHGVIDTRATIRGPLLLDSPPQSMTSKATIEIEPSNRSFDFGPLPEGKYTLKFRGTISGRTRPLTWKDLDIDTTANKSKPLTLSLEAAESE